MSLPVYGITLIKMKSCDTGIAYRIFKTHATVLQSSTEPQNSISRARSVRIFGEFLPPTGRSETTSRIRILLLTSVTNKRKVKGLPASPTPATKTRLDQPTYLLTYLLSLYL